MLLAELLGMAFLAGTVALKAKEEAQKQAKREHREWNDYNTNEKIDGMVNGANTYFESKIEEQKKVLKKQLRTFTDDEIRKALKNSSLSDFRRELLEEEADRRGIF